MEIKRHSCHSFTLSRLGFDQGETFKHGFIDIFAQFRFRFPLGGFSSKHLHLLVHFIVTPPLPFFPIQ